MLIKSTLWLIHPTALRMIIFLSADVVDLLHN